MNYRVDEELNKLIVEESDSRQKEEKKVPSKTGNNSDLQSQIDADGDIHGGGIGTISFVSCGNKEAKEAAEQQVTLTDSTKEEGKPLTFELFQNTRKKRFEFWNFYLVLTVLLVEKEIGAIYPLFIFSNSSMILLYLILGCSSMFNSWDKPANSS